MTLTLLCVERASAGSQLSVKGHWKAESQEEWPAVSIHAALLPTGNLLFWDHADGVWGTPGYMKTTTYLWDPATSLVSTVGQKVLADIFCAGTGLLPDGRFYAAGGHRVSADGDSKFNIYDPFEDTWEKLPDMSQRRWYPTTTLLPDGRLFVSGGWILPPYSPRPGSGKSSRKAISAPIPEIFDFETNRWTRLERAPLSHDNYPFLFVLPDGRLLQGKTHVTRVMDLGTESSWQWEVLAMTVNRNEFGSAAMYRPGKIIKTGGDHGPSDATAVSDIIDTNVETPVWKATDPMHFARHDHNLVILPDGTVLAVGGSSFRNRTRFAVQEAELWDPETEKWTIVATMSEGPRMYHSTAVLLPDGRVIASGGNHHPTKQLYYPGYLFRGPRPKIDSAPDEIVYGSTFRVESADADAIEKVSFMRPGSVTHAFDQGQRYIELEFSVVDGGLEIESPIDANHTLAGPNMLFLVNEAGVPSIGKFISINGVCRNGIDDDHDGHVDYPDDPGCSDIDDSSERDPQMQCDDGIDNDGDGKIDFGPDLAVNDRGCWRSRHPVEWPRQYDCADGIDNDRDGRVDSHDVSCDSRRQATEKHIDHPCDDGVDNDSDGLIDYPQDPGCSGPLSTTEKTACSDSSDNDLDLLIDSDDPDCYAPWDTNEAEPGAQCGSEDPECDEIWDTDETEPGTQCGMGMELVGLVVLLPWIRRRRAA